jgi:hypothetical protein
MRWYFLNTTERFRFALHNPRYVLRAAVRELTLADERFLAASTGLDATRIRSFLQEPFDTADFLGHLLVCESVFRQGMASANLWAKKVLIQYAAVRALRPETIVETAWRAASPPRISSSR